MRGGWIHALPARIVIAPWPSSSVLIQPLYICSRQFAVVRWRAFCVGRTRIYYSTVFRSVRRVPPILLRQRCDGRNKRGVGKWLLARDGRAARFRSRIVRSTLSDRRKRHTGYPISVASD